MSPTTRTGAAGARSHRDEPAKPVALALVDVTAGYGTTTVLRDVSVRVRPGEVVALLGPNGAGKTTMLRTAAGTIRPSSGLVELFGQRVDTRAPWQRVSRGLCLIPEGRGVFKSLTVRENLRMHHAAATDVTLAEAIERALTAFPALGPRLDSPAGILSGGQRQMLALSRAHITRPRVILLDEISMGLAPQIVEQMFDALADLAATGAAIVLVEQFVAQALALADRVVLLSKGHVTFDGRPENLDHDVLLHGYLGIEASAAVDNEVGTYTGDQAGPTTRTAQ